MADDTFASRNIWDIFAGGDPTTKWTKVAEVIGPGDTMRIGADGFIYACKSTDGPASGIMARKDGQDLDTDYAVGDIAPWYPVGQKTVVWGKLLAVAGPIAVRDGLPAIVSTSDDLVSEFTATYVDAAVATDTLLLKLGVFASVDPGHATDMHLVKINLGG